jgi:hypothetical protein
MQALLTHIARAKQQPHHVRRKIAFAAASLGTAFIALMWGTISITSGAFALSDSRAPIAQVVEGNQLASVGAASGEEDEPRIEIVDAVVPGAKVESEKTFIPF